MTGPDQDLPGTAPTPTDPILGNDAVTADARGRHDVDRGLDGRVSTYLRAAAAAVQPPVASPASAVRRARSRRNRQRGALAFAFGLALVAATVGVASVDRGAQRAEVLPATARVVPSTLNWAEADVVPEAQAGGGSSTVADPAGGAYRVAVDEDASPADRVRTRLLRSEDGLSWRVVPTPPEAEPRVLYTDGATVWAAGMATDGSSVLVHGPVTYGGWEVRTTPLDLAPSGVSLADTGWVDLEGAVRVEGVTVLAVGFEPLDWTPRARERFGLPEGAMVDHRSDGGSGALLPTLHEPFELITLVWSCTGGYVRIGADPDEAVDDVHSDACPVVEERVGTTTWSELGYSEGELRYRIGREALTVTIADEGSTTVTATGLAGIDQMVALDGSVYVLGSDLGDDALVVRRSADLVRWDDELRVPTAGAVCCTTGAMGAVDGQLVVVHASSDGPTVSVRTAGAGWQHASIRALLVAAGHGDVVDAGSLQVLASIGPSGVAATVQVRDGHEGFAPAFVVRSSDGRGFSVDALDGAAFPNEIADLLVARANVVVTVAPSLPADGSPSDGEGEATPTAPVHTLVGTLRDPR